MNNYTLQIIVLYSHYTPRFNEVYWYHLVRLSICPSVDRIVSALYPVFKTNGRSVAPGDQKLGWTS